VSTCGVDNKHRDTFLAPTCIRSPVPAAGKGPSGGPKTDATGERYVAYSRSEASKLALLGYTPKAFARGINTHTHTHNYYYSKSAPTESYFSGAKAYNRTPLR